MDFGPGEEFHSTVIRIENPDLWWPAGCGEQHLYRLDIRLFNGHELIDEVQKDFGIRIAVALLLGN